MSTEAFNHAIAFVLPHETEFTRGHFGDFSKEEYVRTENVDGDSGGATRYGIDHSSHPEIDIANLTREGAIDIYRAEWEAHNLDLLPDKLAICAFDVWVNGGHASRWLQHAYNATHPDQPPLTEDGALGPASIAALNGAGQDAMVREFIRQREARFAAIATGPRAKFLAGWQNRDADLLKFLAA